MQKGGKDGQTPSILERTEGALCSFLLHNSVRGTGICGSNILFCGWIVKQNNEKAGTRDSSDAHLFKPKVMCSDYLTRIIFRVSTKLPAASR